MEYSCDNIIGKKCSFVANELNADRIAETIIKHIKKKHPEYFNKGNRKEEIENLLNRIKKEAKKKAIEDLEVEFD